MKSNLFVTIPETALPGGLVVPEFQVMQYLASRSKNGKAVSSRDVQPCANINYHDAVKLAKSSGLQLQRESQRLALQYHIAAQDENWTGGKVGEGKLYKGLHGLSWDHGAKPGNYEHSDTLKRRWMALPGGQRIYDVSGNLWEWVYDDVQGDDKGLIAKPFAKDSPSIVIPYPDRECGQGWTPRAGANWSGRALLRGGYWCSDGGAGVFLLGYDWPGYGDDYVGFRCTK